MRSPLWLEILLLDLRYAWRRLAKNPAFTIVACLSLALGIGANTAAFGVLYAVLLRSLPVKDPAALVVVSTRNTGFQYSMSHPAYLYLRDHASSFQGLIAFRAQPVNVSDGQVTDRVTGMLVTGNYFDVLGVNMALGSPIAAADDRTPGSGGPRGVVGVLSHQYWTRRFNADPAVVGRTVRIDGHPVTVTGVAPASFRGTRTGSLPDVFVPMMFAGSLFDFPNWLENPRNNWLRIMGRLKPDAGGLSRAQAETTVVFRQFNQDVILPLVTTDVSRRRAREGAIVLEPGSAGLLELGTVQPPLFVLMGLVSLVFLIACVNVANLLVARAERYHRDTAISIALGATGARLWSRHLAESLLLGTAASGLGLIFAGWMRGLLVQLMPTAAQLDVSMDAEVLGVSVLLALATTLILGSVTARHSIRVGVIRALKGENVSARLWLRKGLIVGQLALSMMVVVAAALFGQTLSKLRLVDPGFERERILIASTAPRGYTPEQQKAFYARLLDDVAAIPGVASAALASHEPLDVNTGWTLQIRRDATKPPESVGASVAFVSPGYFKTLGIPLLRGRDFTREDGAGPHVIVVNENFVRNYLTAGDPIGQRVVGNGNVTFEVIGVVKDSASIGLRDLDQQMMYVPGGRGVLHVRASVPPASLSAAVEAAARRIDPDVPVFNVRTIEQQLDRFLGREVTFARLASTFGLLALVLSAVGLYGVIAHAVSRRTRELGIRLALGAAPRGIVALVLREAGLLLALGIAAGIPCAYAVGRAIGSLLYEVEPGDWTSLAGAVIVLSSVAAAAAWVPARRASRVDPLAALRSE